MPKPVTEMTAVKAIKTFFEMGAKDAMTEIKALSPEERTWFGTECCRELGMTLKTELTEAK